MNYNNRSAGSCSCSVREAMTPFPEDYSVAMAYVPIQTDISVYDEMKALEVGTLFPVLNKPCSILRGVRDDKARNYAQAAERRAVHSVGTASLS